MGHHMAWKENLIISFSFLDLIKCLYKCLYKLFYNLMTQTGKFSLLQFF